VLTPLIVVVEVISVPDSVAARMNRFNVRLAALSSTTTTTTAASSADPDQGPDDTSETLCFCAETPADKAAWIDALRAAPHFQDRADASYGLGLAKMKLATSMTEAAAAAAAATGLSAVETAATVSDDQDALLTSAAGYFRDAIQMYAKHVRSFCSLGMIGQMRGDDAAAIAGFGAAFKIKPDFPGVRENLAFAHFRQAVAVLKSCSDATPASALAERKLRCEKHFEAAVQVLPSLSKCHLQLAELRLERGDLAGAESAFRAAIASTEDAGVATAAATAATISAESKSGTVTTAATTGHLRGSSLNHHLSTEVSPARRAICPPAYVALGRLLLKRQSPAPGWDAAIEAMRSALLVNPQYVPAHKCLGGVLTEAPASAGGGDGDGSNLRYAEEAFLSAIKFCTEQNKDVESGPDDQWENTVSECWNDLGDLYARQSLALAETPAWQMARLLEEEQQGATGKKAKKNKKMSKKKAKAAAAANDDEGPPLPPREDTIATYTPNPSSQVFDVPLMKKALAAFQSGLGVKKTPVTFYNLAQTLAVRFGLGRGSRSLRTAIEGFLDLDPAYETIIRADPNHALGFFFKDRDNGVHVVDYQGVLAHVASRPDLSKAGRSREVQFCEMLFQRKAEFGSSKETFKIRRVVVLTNDTLLTYKLKAANKQKKGKTRQKERTAVPSKNIPLSGFYKLYASTTSRSARLRTKKGKTLTFVGDHVGIFLKRVEALNPALQRRTAHTLKEMASIAQIEASEASDGVKVQSAPEDKDSREDRAESLQLEELERMLDRDGVIDGDREDKVSDDDGTGWAAEIL
jgi:hypothetical protein